MAEAIKTVLIVALKAEAKPLIQHFRMKKETSIRHIEVFGNQEIFLVTSGLGKVRAAVAAASFFSGMNRNLAFLAINIGIAGASSSTGFEIGSPFLIHKIVDNASGREFFPDMIAKIDFKETHVTTVDRPVSMPTDDRFPTGVVDMEGSGFFEAAATFIPPHHIGCIKIVSDYFDPQSVTSQRVSDLVQKNLPSVDALIAAYKACEELMPVPIVGDTERAFVKTLTEALCLTVSQRHQLTKWIIQYCALKNAALPVLSASLLQSPKSKRERNTRFAELKEIFFSER